MCGLCGIVALERPPETETVRAMAAALDHRGPDGDGSFAAERRRARLPPPGDHRPERRRHAAVRERRRTAPAACTTARSTTTASCGSELEGRGHRFRSQTDTEVIVRAYEEWGDDCVERFNGMWAFALWDGRQRAALLLARPLRREAVLLPWDGGGFVFASELKAFRAAGALEPHLPAVRDYLEQGYVDHTRRDVLRGDPQAPARALARRRRARAAVEPLLGSSSRATCDGDSGRRGARAVPRRGAAAPAQRRPGRDLPLGRDRLVGDRLRRRPPAAHRGRERAARRRPAANVHRVLRGRGLRRAAVRGGGRAQTHSQPHWVTFDSRELVEVLPSIVRTQDEPFGSTRIVAQWFVMRAAKEAGLKVMLDGQGADETLAGYHGYFGPFFADLLRSGRLARARRGAARVPRAARRRCRRRRRRRSPGRSSGAGALGGARPGPRRHRARAPRPRRARTAAAPTASTGGYLRRQMQLILTRRGLPELLHYEDRNSMAHSLEARVPFLDYRLVELLFSLRARDLISRGRTKDVLRRALADLLPPVVRDRVDKLGFVTPEAAGCGTGSASSRRTSSRRASSASAASSTPTRRSGGSKRTAPARRRRLRALARTLRRALGARVPLARPRRLMSSGAGATLHLGDGRAQLRRRDAGASSLRRPVGPALAAVSRVPRASHAATPDAAGASVPPHRGVRAAGS